jgi:hypothetical protein
MRSNVQSPRKIMLKHRPGLRVKFPSSVVATDVWSKDLRESCRCFLVINNKNAGEQTQQQKPRAFH